MLGYGGGISIGRGGNGTCRGRKEKEEEKDNLYGYKAPRTERTDWLGSHRFSFPFRSFSPRVCIKKGSGNQYLRWRLEMGDGSWEMGAGRWELGDGRWGGNVLGIGDFGMGRFLADLQRVS